MGIESSEYQERLSKATTGLSSRIAETNKTVCQIDAVALRSDGKCPVCSRQFAAPPMSTDLSPQERRAAIASGMVPPNTAGLSDQERRDAAFWQRKRGKTKEPTLTDRVQKFFTEDVRIGPNGERLVTKKLVEM